MRQREVQGKDHVRWVCVQALSGVAGVYIQDTRLTQQIDFDEAGRRLAAAARPSPRPPQGWVPDDELIERRRRVAASALPALSPSSGCACPTTCRSRASM